MSTLFQIIIAIIGAFFWELLFRNPVYKLFMFFKKKYVWKKIFDFRSEFAITKSKVTSKLTRESDNLVEREILTKLGTNGFIDEEPQLTNGNFLNQNMIVIGSPRYNKYAALIQKKYLTNLEYVYDSYEVDPANKVLKIISEPNVEYISSSDLKTEETKMGIDYGILFIAKLKNNKKIIWISGIHGAGTVGVFKYLRNHAENILNAYPKNVGDCTSWLFRIYFRKQKKECLDMIKDIELIGYPQISKPRDIERKPKVMICDLGNVIMLFDRFRTYRAIGHRLKTPYFNIKNAIEETNLRQKYETGKISDKEFYEKVLFLVKATKKKLPFDLFCEFWGDIFWPNKKMIDALNILKDQLNLVLLSNTNNIHFSNVKEHYSDILEMFDNRIILSYKEKISKPNIKIYEKAIKIFKDENITYGDCIYVDDREENVRMANKLGMKGIVFFSYPQFVYSMRKFGLYVP